MHDMVADEFDECEGCGNAFPAGYLALDGFCDDCFEDLEDFELDWEDDEDDGDREHAEMLCVRQDVNGEAG